MDYKYCPSCGKKLSEYETKIECCETCYEDWSYESDYDEDAWREEMEERKQNELAQRASMCKCGAWQFAKNGDVVHVADCYCGAE